MGSASVSVRRASAWLVILSLALALAIANVGCGSGPERHRVSVRIELMTYTEFGAQRRHQTFSLTCGPVSGTLPLAARVCREIGRHPQAMLDPGRPRSVCAGGPFMPELTVVATRNAKVTRFSGAPFCDWPGGTALGIYWEATQRDDQQFDRLALRLRCDDDPVLLARPTPNASVVACTHGLWTPRSERLIRLAMRAPKLAALQSRALFPSDVGALRCTIPGPFVQKFHGLCGVYLKRVWSKPLVTFVETWRQGNHRTARHRWRVIVRNGRATVVSETGPVPPQLWR